MCNCPGKRATPLNELPTTRTQAPTGLLAGEPVAVTFAETLSFPVDVLLPLRLIGYNRNGRKLRLTGRETTLPKALAVWLAQESPLRGKVVIDGNGA